jgi:hypothetical protein
MATALCIWCNEIQHTAHGSARLGDVRSSGLFGSEDPPSVRDLSVAPAGSRPRP